MHPFSILTLGIFVAGYITARWDLVTRLYELAIFAIDHGVVVSHYFRLTIYGEITDSVGLDPCCQGICNSIHILLPLHLAN